MRHELLLTLSALTTMMTPRMAGAEDGAEWWWSGATRAAAETAVRGEAGSEGALALTVSGRVERIEPRPWVPRLDADGAAWLGVGGDEPPVGATHRARLRLPEARLEAPPVVLWFEGAEFSHQFEWQARPSPTSRRGLWRRPYTRAAASLSLGVFALGTDTWRVGCFALGLDIGHVRQRDGDVRAKQDEAGFEVVFFRVQEVRAERAPMTLDVLAVDVDGVDDGEREASVGEIAFARVRGLRLFGTDVFADAHAGVSGTGSMRIGVSAEVAGAASDEAEPDEVPGEDWSRTIDTTHLPAVTTGVYGARLYGSHGPFTAELDVHRALYLTFDIELALEHRVEAGLDWSGGANALALSGFAAHTLVWPGRDDPEARERALTGGVHAGWQRRLGSDVELGLELDLARSFYASLEGAATPRPELAARVGAALTSHFGSVHQASTP